MPPIPPQQQPPLNGGTLLLTIPEAAAELRISRSKLYQILAAKRLPFIKVDTATRIERSALNAYVQALSEAQTHPAEPSTDGAR